MININVMKCYKYVFTKDIIKNYGFYIMSAYIIIYIICFFIFVLKSYIKIKNDIDEIFNALKNSESPQKEIKQKCKTKKKQKEKKNKKKKHKYNDIKSNKIKYKKIDNIQSTNIKNNDNKHINLNNQDISNRIITNTNNDENKIIIEFKDFELNSLKYEEAKEKDKRSYIQFYISLIKNNHPIFFSFCNDKDYNSRIIKIFLFFFPFCSNLAINALFFNDNTIHKIYNDKGKYNFVYQIPQILYSSLISILIGTLIKMLAFSQENISKFKQIKEKTTLDKELKELLNTLKIKFISFFIFSFILLLFFWYYLTCFCGIYENNQIHLIKDTICSFISSLIYPFVFCFIPGIFRIYALKISNSCLYKFSLLIGKILV